MAKITALHEISKEFISICVEFSEIVQSSCAKVVSGDASRRLVDSVYRLLGCLDCFLDMTTLFFLIVENHVMEPKSTKFAPQDAKMLKQILTFAQHVRQKLASNQYIPIFQEFTQLLPSLKRKYCTKI